MKDEIILRCSSLERYEACPASYWLEKQAPPEIEGEDAARGTRIHKALAGELVKLSPDEQELAEMMLEQVASMVPEGPDERHCELYIELDFPGGKITGTCDRFESCGTRGYVVDYKTGRNAVEDAALNLQLAGYALMAAKKFPHLTEFEVIVIQPLAKGGGSRHVFQRQELAVAWKRIRAIFDAVAAAKTSRTVHPSQKACEYCKALPICGAHRQNIAALAVMDTDAQRWELATREEKLELWRRMELARKALGRFRALFMADLKKDPNAFEGQVYLKTTKGAVTVTDVGELYEDFRKAVGLTGQEFAMACKPVMTKLKPIVKRRSQLKGKAFETWYKQTVEKRGERGKGKTTLETAKPAIR